jgi:hypothetical protein
MRKVIKITRDGMAFIYAGILSGTSVYQKITNGEDVYPWRDLNYFIIKRWSKSGLHYVKDKAHKIIDAMLSIETNEL